VFTRVPVAGKVKTRLIGLLSAEQSCELARACLADTIALAKSLPRCRRVLYVEGSRAAARSLGRALHLSGAWRIETQSGANLGARMRNAIGACFHAGCEKAVLIGTDTPWMGRRRLSQALRALDQADVVLGPASDGGYYLVGARRTLSAQNLREMFHGVDWGTSRVFPQSVAKLRRARIPFRLLSRDFDLDRPEEFARTGKLLRRNPRRARALASWMKEWREAIS
jgi:rSAM/selenodomain-associated transferase 1